MWAVQGPRLLGALAADVWFLLQRVIKSGVGIIPTAAFLMPVSSVAPSINGDGTSQVLEIAINQK